MKLMDQLCAVYVPNVRTDERSFGQRLANGNAAHRDLGEPILQPNEGALHGGWQLGAH